MTSARPHRLTLIIRDSRKPDLDWNYRAGSRTRVLFLDSVPVLKFALNTPDLDVERVVIDRAADADSFLGVLAELPEHFTGDVVLIREDRTAFLSTTTRGGGRMLYSLGAHDLRFYLETLTLVTGRSVPQYEERMSA